MSGRATSLNNLTPNGAPNGSGEINGSKTSLQGSNKLGGSSVIKIGGATDNSDHTISEDEYEQFSIHINSALAKDSDLKNYLPIVVTDFSDLFKKSNDGILLSKLINHSVPDTIDERVLNKGKISTFQATENCNVVISSAKAIGCTIVNIGAADIKEGREYLIMGLVWQIIKIGLFAKVDLIHHPELFRLLEEGESLDDLFKLPVDQILLRWVNYHLKKANWNRKVNDIKDSENYIVLLNQLKPDQCNRDALKETDLKARAEKMLQNADKIGCRKYVGVKAVTSGNPKLNLAFVANLFNTHPCLEPLTEAEKATLDEWLFKSVGDREARAFALWLNSIGVDPFVNSLYDDLRDGVILLQAMEKIHPGSVNQKAVNTKQPMIRFKMLENTNYVVVLAKGFKYTMESVQGADITDGSRTLTLGLVWQMMRDNVVQVLKTLSADGKDVTEADMIQWANDTVIKGGKSSTMTSFKDPSLKTSVFFLDVLNGIKKGNVDYNLVTAGTTDDDAKMNAKYAISIARKLGAVIFLLPEDILEVKPKMILTFIGAMMAVGQQLKS